MLSISLTKMLIPHRLPQCRRKSTPPRQEGAMHIPSARRFSKDEHVQGLHQSLRFSLDPSLERYSKISPPVSGQHSSLSDFSSAILALDAISHSGGQPTTCTEFGCTAYSTWHCHVSACQSSFSLEIRIFAPHNRAMSSIG